LNFLQEKLKGGAPPYQAFIDAARQVQFELDDAQMFRISLIKEIEKQTQRRLIVYETHLSKGAQIGANMLNEEDKIGFCSLIENVSEKELDILIQSPGGRVEAVEQLVKMLRAQFGHIRFIIPDTAKSAATMFALSGDCLLMDERSELGPIDPQVAIGTPGGIIYVPAHTIVKGFEKAKDEIQNNPAAFLAYNSMLRKYDLHIFEICRNAEQLAKNLVSGWLATYMFRGQSDAVERANYIAEELCAHEKLLSHGRPITIDKCHSLKLDVIDLRKNPQLREKIWLLHVAYHYHLDNTPAVKIYENSAGTSWHRQLIIQPAQQSQQR
jgi:hypothetical protein